MIYTDPQHDGREEDKVKITKRQLRRIIKEERRKLLREQFDDEPTMLSRPGTTPQRYFPDLDQSHEYEGASGGAFRKDTLADMQQAIDYFRDRGAEEDALDLEEILAMAVKELASGAEYPSEALFNRITYETDTVIREEIPHEIMQWTTSYDDSEEY
jgi:hypothetical protein